MKIRKPLAALLATATMAALAATSGAATALAIENPTVTVHLDQTGCTENTNNTNCQITHGSACRSIPTACWSANPQTACNTPMAMC